MTAEGDCGKSRGAPSNAWGEYAERLAEWAERLLVNRTDRFGRYTALSVRGTLKDDGTRIGANYTAWDLTRGHLVRHFRGLLPQHVVGLHSTSPANTCRWGAYDVDRHDDATDPRLTLDLALSLYRELQARGFRVLLDGLERSGGVHLRIIFRQPVPSRDLYHLLRQIARQAGFQGEQFPKQAALSDRTRFGSWLRLPGRHHTRDVWATVFDGSRWLAGAEAIAWILSFTGDDPALVPPAPPERQTPRRPPVMAGGGEGETLSLEVRISRYVSKCPNLAEGQGRDDVAYNLAAFLVRDLELPDHVALPWLSAWDRHNNPPKGDERLIEIVANARTYGSRPYGHGLERRHP